ncbi:MAG TPA: YaeQ family protein [Albitalea sp.]
MALKATIYKANVQLADMDRSIYGDHALTLARHPSETDERMMIRLLAYALNAPASNDHGALDFAKDLWDTDEPALWQKDLTEQIVQWIDVGQPDEKRMMRASSRAQRVSVYGFAASTPIWWAGVATKITRASNLAVWQVPAEQSQALAGLAQRTMHVQVTVQDGHVWVGDGERSVEITPQQLYGAR